MIQSSSYSKFKIKKAYCHFLFYRPDTPIFQYPIVDHKIFRNYIVHAIHVISYVFENHRYRKCINFERKDFEQFDKVFSKDSFENNTPRANYIVQCEVYSELLSIGFRYFFYRIEKTYC